jgi:hypothetical protein
MLKSLQKVTRSVPQAVKFLWVHICLSYLIPWRWNKMKDKKGQSFGLLSRFIRDTREMFLKNVSDWCSICDWLILSGDANPLDDRSLYANGQHWLKPQQIIGRAVA